MRAWDNWWFGRGSPTTLGLFRIMMGSLAFVNLAMMLGQVADWYYPHGYVPLELAKQWTGPELRVALLNGVDNPTLTWIFYLAVMACALLTAVGLWTRIAAPALAIGMVSLHHRDPFILHSGDTLMRVTLCYLAFAPCGAGCSVDRLIRLMKGKEIEPPQVSLWAQRLIQVQTALLYFTTLWYKSYGFLWRNGTATYYPAKLHEFERFPSPGFVDQQPFLLLGTYGTLIVEFSLGVLVFYKPFRKWALLGGLALHTTIEYRFNIPLFAFVVCSTYICFFEGWEIDAWAKRVGERFSRLMISVPMPKNPKVARVLSAVDPFGWLRFGDQASSDGFETKAWKRSVGAWLFGPLVYRKWWRAGADGP